MIKVDIVVYSLDEKSKMLQKCEIKDKKRWKENSENSTQKILILLFVEILILPVIINLLLNHE